jgi:hypothetical protein
MDEAVTELDEIVLVTKMAWALRHVADPLDLEDPVMRRHSYRQEIGVDLHDYCGILGRRLDRKAVDSETQRRALAQTKVSA